MNKDRLSSVTASPTTANGITGRPTLIETAPAIERFWRHICSHCLPAKCDYSQFDFVGEKPTCAISKAERMVQLLITSFRS